MGNRIQIYEQGLEEYPLPGVIIGNVIILLWIGLGALACWFYLPLLSYIYLISAYIMVYFVLRKLVCTNCYYYGKQCAVGWGKIAALLFKQGKIENFSSSIGIKIAPITYGLITIIPILALTIAMIQKFTTEKLILLFLFLLVSFYSSIVARKKTCAKCKMRLICPGCAVK